MYFYVNPKICRVSKFSLTMIIIGNYYMHRIVSWYNHYFVWHPFLYGAVTSYGAAMSYGAPTLYMTPRRSWFHRRAMLSPVLTVLAPSASNVFNTIFRVQNMFSCFVHSWHVSGFSVCSPVTMLRRCGVGKEFATHPSQGWVSDNDNEWPKKSAPGE